MVKPTNFSTEYTTLLPDDYLKVSKTGDTEDKCIKYSNFLDQITTDYINTTVITSYSIDSTSGDLILNNATNGKGFTLKENVTLIVRFAGITYNWQNKKNINLKLFDLTPIPLINGYMYDKFNSQWLDVNTIGNGLIKFVYDNNLKKWKLYKIGSESGTIKESFKDTQHLAGCLNLTDDMSFDPNLYPSFYKQFTTGSTMINSCIAGVEDGVTNKGNNYGVLAISPVKELGRLKWIYGGILKDVDGNELTDDIAYGSFSTDNYYTHNSLLSQGDNGMLRYYTTQIHVDKPTQTVTLPDTIPTNDFDILPRRYGCYYMLVL